MRVACGRVRNWGPAVAAAAPSPPNPTKSPCDTTSPRPTSATSSLVSSLAASTHSPSASCGPQICRWVLLRCILWGSCCFRRSGPLSGPTSRWWARSAGIFTWIMLIIGPLTTTRQRSNLPKTPKANPFPAISQPRATGDQNRLQDLHLFRAGLVERVEEEWRGRGGRIKVVHRIS